MNAIEQLKSVLCDNAGKCSIIGSDEDRAIVDRALQALAEQREQEPVEQLGDGVFWCDTCRSVQETKDHSDPNDRDVWCKGEAAWLQGPFYTTPPAAAAAAPVNERMEVLDCIKDVLPEFRQQDDYLLAHGALLLSEQSHEIIHIDTALRIAGATPPAAAQPAPKERT